MKRATPTRPPRDNRETAAAIDALGARVTRLEREQRLLRTTTCAIAREAGVTIGGPCSRCGRSYVLVASNTMRCPACGDGRSM
ncbi:hypothetical protein [Halopiger xanaduensis]|uniref:Sjogrens syndrome scleroderma autoantigen 1 n=1 Tax=Halopiger xanaduensis (strain DSM 18323 / JCM 14033 / SH-6) TaxID=797210 RepID=F8D694_HALXS|nr:hypothetical protein [Halopiger xanaduensis]AEH35340.1 hypothetical protein Halxa_0701 [Halopiger xanaduensis SH-6]